MNLGLWSNREIKVWSTGVEAPVSDRKDCRRKFQKKIVKILFGACKILTCRCLVNSQCMRYREIKEFIPLKILHYAAVTWWLPNLSGHSEHIFISHSDYMATLELVRFCSKLLCFWDPGWQSRPANTCPDSLQRENTW